MRAFPLLLLFVTIGAAEFSLTGCASVGGGRDKCIAAAGDSVYRAYAPVYAACAVSRTAKVTSQPFPDWRPTVNSLAEAGRCYSADLEFVVDTTGRAIPETVHILRTNTPDMADAFVAKLPVWRFDPAFIGDAKVRQIMKFGARVQSTVTVVRSTAGMPSGPVPTTGGPVHMIASC